ncbi:MAG: DNA replication and repair protein RecF [Thermoanaerobaculia bacterium]
MSEAPTPGPADTATLRRLRAARFRALTPIDWRPTAGWNLIHGPNGSGKSSVLEAIYLTATGRSFRTPALAECCARGEESFLVQTKVERGGSWDLGLAYSASADGRRLTLQDKPSALADHLALLPVVAWSEAERELVTGPAVARRRFLDRAALLLRPPRLAEHAELYRALAQKRHLLAARGRDSAAELGAWNELLAPLVARRARERADLVGRLETAASSLLARHGADLPPLRLTYQPSPANALAGATAVAEALAAAASGERERGQPLVGPQRDRVEILLDTAAARRSPSAGERKVLVLSLLAGLAQLLSATGRAPLVLLDDLDAELDRERLGLAVALFTDAPQILATSSRAEVFAGCAPGLRWSLAKGAISDVPSSG